MSLAIRTFHDLSALTGVPERQIRYLISEGFVPSPRGSRAKPEYGEDHVDAIRRYTQLREKGFPPAAIKLLLEDRHPVAPGIDLVVDRHRLDEGTDLDAVAGRISELLKDLLKGKADDSDRPQTED